MATAHRTDETHQRSGGGSEILDRLPPHNLDAEKGVLGSLLLDPQLCDDVALIVRPEDFYSDTAARLFATMRAMHDEGGRIDMTLLVERLKHDGQFDPIGGSAYLAEIVRAVPVAAHAEYYAEIVRDKALLRALIHTSTEILRDAYDPSVNPREIVNSAEQRIFAVHDQRSSDQLTSIHDALIETFEQIDARMAGGSSGVPSGFTDLDNLTGGMHDSELIILAARPAMGKTALATNIADYVAVKSNVATLFVSLEMSRFELSQRMLCARGEISGRKFRSDFLSGEDRKTLMQASSKLSTSPLFIDDTPSRTMTEIAATSRRLKRRHNLGLVVIDYLQLIEPDNSRDPRQEQVAKIARRLKGLARELEIPVLCLAQLNRQAEASKDNIPRLSHLRESGAIEQDADVVMFVHREEYYHQPDEVERRGIKGKADLMVKKQRNGPTGDIKLLWFQQFTRFKDAAPDSYDEFE